MNSLDKQYQTLLKDIIYNGVSKGDRTGVGTLSLFGRQIRHKMSEGFPLLTTKKMAWHQIKVELLWFLKGDTNIKWLIENNCNIWNGDAYKHYCKNVKVSDPGEILSMKEFVKEIMDNPTFCNMWGNLGPIYGKQWRNGGERSYWKEGVIGDTLDNKDYTYLQIEPIDQIKDLIEKLKTDPDNRRLMVSAWNVSEISDMTLPPCHYSFQCWTREMSNVEIYEHHFNCKLSERDYPHAEAWVIKQKPTLIKLGVPVRKLSLLWNQRSVDTFLGAPFNIASYGLLLSILADLTNMIPDELIGNLGDTHLYTNHIEAAKEQMFLEGYPLPKLDLCIEGDIDTLKLGDIGLGFYQSHDIIKAPLNN
jgi:thymidylate synthase